MKRGRVDKICARKSQHRSQHGDFLKFLRLVENIKGLYDFNLIFTK